MATRFLTVCTYFPLNIFARFNMRITLQLRNFVVNHRKRRIWIVAKRPTLRNKKTKFLTNDRRLWISHSPEGTIVNDRATKNWTYEGLNFVCSLIGHVSSLIVNEEIIIRSFADWRNNKSIYRFVRLTCIPVSIFNCTNYIARHSACAQKRTLLFFNSHRKYRSVDHALINERVKRKTSNRYLLSVGAFFPRSNTGAQRILEQTIAARARNKMHTIRGIGSPQNANTCRRAQRHGGLLFPFFSSSSRFTWQMPLIHATLKSIWKNKIRTTRSIFFWSRTARGEKALSPALLRRHICCRRNSSSVAPSTVRNLIYRACTCTVNSNNA